MTCKQTDTPLQKVRIKRYRQTNIHFIIIHIKSVQVTTFMGSPLSNEVLEAVAVKMLGKAETKQTSEKITTAATLTTEYYSTVRPKGHRHDKWRTKLDKEQVGALQCGPCGEVLRKLGYQRLDHSDDTN